MRHPLFVLPASVLLLTACAAGSTAAPADGAGSASPAATAHPVPPSDTGRPSPTSKGCTSAATITARRGEQPTPLCLTPGAALRIHTEPSPHQPWGPFTSTDNSVVRCTSETADDGATQTTCLAVRPGTAIVSTTTAPFSADPHGPPQDTWQLHITVAVQ